MHKIEWNIKYKIIYTGMVTLIVYRPRLNDNPNNTETKSKSNNTIKS